MTNIIAKFEDDMATDADDCDEDEPKACSVINSLMTHDEDNKALVAWKKTNEQALFTQQREEISKWLSGHVEDLQGALAEVCQQEHAYHYNPPGY